MKIHRKKNKKAIIFTEIPYQVNKANLIIKIAELVQEKKITGISDLRDESDRKGMRIYVELKRDASEEIVLNQLYKHTPLQNSFGINMVALVRGIPKTLNLKEILTHFVEHRKEVITKRTEYDLRKAKDRLHILEGLKIALDNIDEVIALIKASKDTPSARASLMERFKLTEKQSNAILEMRLQRLTGLERDKIEAEYNDLLVTIADLEDILANISRIYGIIKDELEEIKSRFGDDRKTDIGASVDNMSIEDLIPKKPCAILISKNGFIKRVPTDTFKSQNRGGRGVNSMTTRDEDSIDQFLITSTHDYVLFFTTKGRVFKIKAYQVPESSRQSKGVSIAHFLNLEENELLTTAIQVTSFETDDYLFMTTKKGIVKKTALNAFIHFKNRPIAAIKLDDNDTLRWVTKTTGENDIILVTTAGMAIKFNESQVRPMGRASRGVKGIKVKPEDSLISMNTINTDVEKLLLLIITKYGYGKNIRVSEFKNQNRGGIGVKCLKFRKSIPDDAITDAVTLERDQEIMIVTQSGIMCRQEVRKISTQKRESQGVIIMKLDNKDYVTALSVVRNIEDEEPTEPSNVEQTKLIN